LPGRTYTSTYAGLFTWWTIGVAILTFHSPYVRTGNAYFAAWCAWAASGRLLVHQFPQLRGYHDFGGEGAPEPKGGSAPLPEVSPTYPSATAFGNPHDTTPALDEEAELPTFEASPQVVIDDEEPTPTVNMSSGIATLSDNDI
jgi:hypothetical protein